MERLRTRLDTGEHWRDELRSALGDCAREDAVVAHPSGKGVLVSHLVARNALATYRARLDAWRHASGSPRVAVLGPWPPFSFAAEATP